MLSLLIMKISYHLYQLPHIHDHVNRSNLCAVFVSEDSDPDMFHYSSVMNVYNEQNCSCSRL